MIGAARQENMEGELEAETFDFVVVGTALEESLLAGYEELLHLGSLEFDSFSSFLPSSVYRDPELSLELGRGFYILMR